MGSESRRWGGLLLVVMCLLACNSSSKKQGGRVTLSGRVFSADLGTPLAGVEVRAPDGAVVKSGDDGRFVLRHAVDKEGPVETKREDYAPVSKGTPKGEGYIELFVKEVDGKAELAGNKGGRVKGKGGASVSVGKSTLVYEDGKPADKARVSIASPDPTKPTDLPALPGNFEAKSGEKRGKISAESPLHIQVRDGDEKDLTLGEGKSLDADLPARRADTSSEAALFRFDDAAQTWVFVSKVPRVGSKTGKPIPNAQVDPGEPVYRAKLDKLGWWAVGEFFDELTCVHACVVDEDGKGVPFARALATGVDHFTQLTAYADEQGCFALDVRAKAQISVSVQASAGYAPGKVFETGDSGPSVEQGIDACQDLGTFTLAKQSTDDCPLGLRACGAACVDTRSDRANCGECDNPCGGSAGRELSCVAGSCECAFGQRDCSGEYCAASQTDDGNCGGCGIVCTGDTRCIAGTCKGKDDSGLDAGMDGGIPSDDAGVDIGPDGGASGLPMLAVAPTKQAFGPTLVNEMSPAFRFTFTNTGSGTATGCSAPVLTGKHATEFAIANDTCGTADLAAKASCTIDVTVTPTTTGERVATLTRTCAQGGAASTVADGLSVNRPHYIFVTSTESAGNLGSLAGADMTCNDVASKGTLSSGLGLSWRALLSIKDTVDARNRIAWTGPVYDIRNLLATNDPTIWPWTVDGTSATPQLLRVDENGTQAKSYVWTGTNSSGLATGNDCAGWTSNSNAFIGQAGETGNFVGTSTTWIDSFTNDCSNTFFSLMCVSDNPP